MLPVYLITYRNFNIAKDSLDSFISTATEELDITIALVNDTLPNSGTGKIKQYVSDLIKEGKVSRLLAFETNCFGYGLMAAVRDFPPQEELFMISDMDLIIPENTDWVGLSRKYHKDHWVVTGFNLSTVNYKSEFGCVGFDPNCSEFGMWGQVHKTEWFNANHGTEKLCIDSDIMGLARYTGGATKIREIEAIHAAWSLNDPSSPYYDFEYGSYKRARNSNWIFDPKPENMRYELIEK